MYGAFGVPIALLLWINFTAKLVLVCAAWTATPLEEGGPREADADDGTDGATEEQGGATRARPAGETPRREPFQR